MCMHAGDMDPITKEPFPEAPPLPILQPQQLNVPQQQHKHGSAPVKGGSAGTFSSQPHICTIKVLLWYALAGAHTSLQTTA